MIMIMIDFIIFTFLCISLLQRGYIIKVECDTSQTRRNKFTEDDDCKIYRNERLRQENIKMNINSCDPKGIKN
jgi:hypothetical protein